MSKQKSQYIASKKRRHPGRQYGIGIEYFQEPDQTENRKLCDIAGDTQDREKTEPLFGLQSRQRVVVERSPYQARANPAQQGAHAGFLEDQICQMGRAHPEGYRDYSID